MQIKPMTEQEWQPHIRFVDQSPSFVHGWEMGKICAKLEIEKFYEGLMHSVNLEQLEIICKRMGFEFFAETIGEQYEEWRQVKVTPLLRVLHSTDCLVMKPPKEVE